MWRGIGSDGKMVQRLGGREAIDGCYDESGVTSALLKLCCVSE